MAAAVATNVILLLVACTLALSVSAKPVDYADCGYPNGTETQLNVFNCDPNEKIIVQSAVITFDNGTSNYPVDPSKPFVLQLLSYNYGDQYNDNKVDVQIYEYAKGLGSSTCSWNAVPTFGLLNNIDGCNFAHNCPLTQKQLTLNIRLDLSQFSVIINALAKNKPYQLTITMKNGNTGSAGEKIACVIAQLNII